MTTTQQDDAATVPSRRRSRRRNHWATQTPDDHVHYPHTERLTYLQMCKLVERAQSGDIAAFQQLWFHFIRLPVAVINHFGVPAELFADALQAGNMGIARAIRKFDISRLNDFSTYAWQWVRQSIQRFLVDQCFGQRIPAHLWKPYHQFRHGRRHADTREAWYDWFIRLLEHDRAGFIVMQRLHAIIEPQRDRFALRAVPAPPAEPLHLLRDAEDVALLREALDRLSPVQREVLILRYGLFDQPEQTLEEIGQRRKLTRERVRQIQQRAEQLLRRFLLDDDEIELITAPASPEAGQTEADE